MNGRRIFNALLMAVSIYFAVRIELMIFGDSCVYNFLILFNIGSYPHPLYSLFLISISVIICYLFIGKDIVQLLLRYRFIIVALSALFIFITIVFREQTDFLILYTVTVAIIVSLYHIAKADLSYKNYATCPEKKLELLEKKIGEIMVVTSQDRAMTSAVANYLFKGEEFNRNLMKNMPPASGNLRLYQKASIHILREFIEFCNKNGLECWICWGTLLGSIRHKGFVPWDDDVDVSMEKGEFDKLSELLDKKDAPFRLIVYKCKGYRIVFSDHDRFPFIDIYTFRYSPMFYEKSESINIIDHNLYDDLLNKLDYPSIWEPYSGHRAKIEDMISKSTSEKIVDASLAKSIYYCANHFEKNSFPIDAIYPLKNDKFEGLDVCIPNDPETVLTLTFGDYWALPKDIETHHHTPVDAISNEMRGLISDKSDH